MNRLSRIARDRLHQLRDRRRKKDEIQYIPVPPLNEDLSELTEHDIRNEISAVKRRLELGLVEPEGVSGLNYRLHRLMAQQEVVKKKGEHERPRQDTK